MFGDVTRHVDARAQYDDRIRNSHTHSHTSGSLPKPYRKVGPKKYSYFDTIVCPRRSDRPPTRRDASCLQPRWAAHLGRKAGMPSRLAPDERYSRCDRQSSQTARKIAPMLNARSFYFEVEAEARSHPATKSGRAKKVAKSVRPKIVDPVLEVRTASATASGQAGTKVGQHAAYRVDIDGLRAVAVTAVIVYHVDHAWLPGGFTGVDVNRCP